MVTNWIRQENAEPFLITLGWVVGYSFDQNDWEVLSEGLLDAAGSVSYEFAGTHCAKLKLEYDQTAKAFRVAIDVPSELEPQVELAMAIFQRFGLRKRQSRNDEA